MQAYLFGGLTNIEAVTRTSEGTYKVSKCEMTPHCVPCFPSLAVHGTKKLRKSEAGRQYDRSHIPSHEVSYKQVEIPKQFDTKTMSVVEKPTWAPN